MCIKKTFITGLSVVVCGWLGALTAYGGETMHARISYDGGGGMVKGSADADWSYATTNTLILPDDTLWVDKGGSLELEMTGGTFLRLADGSKSDIKSLPPNGLIHAWTGSFYVQRVSRSTGDMTVGAPACSLEIQRDSQVRIDVVGAGSTTVTVRWGRVTVRTDVGQPVIVHQGRQCYVDPGFLPSAPLPFSTDSEDDFDVWNRERAKTLALGTEAIPARTTIYDDAPLGAYDLTPYGRWVTVENSYYWQPTIIADYVPYRTGRWSYVPRYGYVWVGDYPFCYVTSHYGRWTYRNNYGWLWSYQSAWSPAWVATVRYGDNFVWCPLDPFDRPVYYGNAYFTVGGTRFGMTTSSFCPADSLLFYGPVTVLPCTPAIIHNVRPADICIWNISTPGRTHPWRPQTGSSLPLRDYSPRRVIRGPDTIGPRGIQAAARIAALESTDGRAAYQTVGATGERGLRTPMSDSARTARMRAVSVDSSLQPTATEAVRRAVRAQSPPEERVASRTEAPSAAAPPDTSTPTPRATDAETGGRFRAVKPSGRDVTPSGEERAVEDSAAPRRPRVEQAERDALPRTDEPNREVTQNLGRDAQATPPPERGARVVRLTRPSSANPPAEMTMRQPQLRETPRGGDAPLVKPERAPLPLRNVKPRMPAAVTPLPSRSVEPRVPAAVTPLPSRSIEPRAPAVTPLPSRSIEPRVPAVTRTPSRAIEAPAPPRFEMPSRIAEVPERVPMPSRTIEAPAPPRIQLAPRVIEAPAPQMTPAPLRVIESPAPRRFEAAPRVMEAPAPPRVQPPSGFSAENSARSRAITPTEPNRSLDSAGAGIQRAGRGR